MELENLTAGQILSVLENVHSNASDLHEEMGIEYSDALVKVFHDLWTATENWSVKAGDQVQTLVQLLPTAEMGTAHAGDSCGS
jgi:hypothetical protein